MQLAWCFELFHCYNCKCEQFMKWIVVWYAHKHSHFYLSIYVATCHGETFPQIAWTIRLQKFPVNHKTLQPQRFITMNDLHYMVCCRIKLALIKLISVYKPSSLLAEPVHSTYWIKFKKNMSFIETKFKQIWKRK